MPKGAQGWAGCLLPLPALHKHSMYSHVLRFKVFVQLYFYLGMCVLHPPPHIFYVGKIYIYM